MMVDSQTTLNRNIFNGLSLRVRFNSAYVRSSNRSQLKCYAILTIASFQVTCRIS